jgi:arylsulfatase A-like enzyme
LFILGRGGIGSSGRREGSGIADLAPTLLALAGIDVPGWMDGQVMADLLPEGIVVRRADGPDPPRAAGGESHYGPEQEREIAARLAALGYVDGTS